MIRTKKRIALDTIRILALIVVSLICLAPFYVALCYAFKSKQEFAKTKLAFPTYLDLTNFKDALGMRDYFITMRNSAVCAFFMVLIVVILCSLAAYIIARRNNKFYNFVFYIFQLVILIPFQTIMITLLKFMNIIHLNGTTWGLGIQYWGFGIPMATFIFHNFMQTIPKELDESAQIDGAGTIRTFLSVIFPLLKSVTTTVVVLDVMWIWNDFLLPLLMVNATNKTKTLVLAAYSFVGQMNTQWQYAMAAMVLAVLPSIVIFIFLQKYIVEGVVAGAVKG